MKQPPDEHTREARFELADLVGRQHIVFDAVLVHQPAPEGTAGETLLGTIDLQPADRPDICCSAIDGRLFCLTLLGPDLPR